jgi:phospholipid transport system substrate-binding protein
MVRVSRLTSGFFALFLLLALPVWHSPAYAASTEAAQAFVNKMADKTLGIIANSEMTQDQKKSAFRKMLLNHFDMDTIGRFALGRYWNTATPAQRKEYLTLLNDAIINVYTERFADYKGEKLEVESARPEGNGDVFVTSNILLADGPKVKVEWRVREKEGKFRIVDVIVQDISMVVTKRSDFAAVIQRGGGSVDVLLDYLRQSKSGDVL